MERETRNMREQVHKGNLYNLAGNRDECRVLVKLGGTNQDNYWAEPTGTQEDHTKFSQKNTMNQKTHENRHNTDFSQ